MICKGLSNLPFLLFPSHQPYTLTHLLFATWLPQLQYHWLPCVSYSIPGTLLPHTLAFAFVSAGNACLKIYIVLLSLFFSNLSSNVILTKRSSLVTLQNVGMHCFPLSLLSFDSHNFSFFNMLVFKLNYLIVSSSLECKLHKGGIKNSF